MPTVPAATSETPPSASESDVAGPSTVASRRAARLAREAAGIVQPKGRRLGLEAGEHAENDCTMTYTTEGDAR